MSNEEIQFCLEQLNEMRHIDRAKLGHKAWNYWAENNEGVAIDFTGQHLNREGKISFKDFIFPGDVSFRGETLYISTFENATFKGEADFLKVIFDQAILFTGVKFLGGDANFIGAKFVGSVSFSGAEFVDSDAYFSGAEFMGSTHFQKTKFNNQKALFNGGIFRNRTLFDQVEFNCDNVDFSKIEANCDLVSFKRAKFTASRVDFELAKFNARMANFESVDFINASVDFNGSQFSGGAADFSGAIYNNSDARFDNAIFEYQADFSAVEFQGGASFSSVIFKGPVIFEMASFHYIPDFLRSKLSTHFTFHKMFLNKSYKGDPSAADKLRRLKELAIDAKDHDRELAFFADELRAIRLNQKIGPRFVSILFERCSDFGRSIWRPSVGLFVTWFLFGFGYFLSATNPPNNLTEGLTLSGATLIPFVSASRATMVDAREALFWPEANGWVNTAAFFEGFIGIIFIFLIGLALRNRFRI